MQTDKNYFAQRNEELAREINSLRDTIHQMKKEHQYKTETVMMELVDTRNSRDALCCEGRNIVNTIKSWMREQQEINKQLSEKLLETKYTLSKLKSENE